MPSTVLLPIEAEAVSNRLSKRDIAREEERSCGNRKSRRGAGERSMPADEGMTRPPSQLRALGRSMLICSGWNEFENGHADVRILWYFGVSADFLSRGSLRCVGCARVKLNFRRVRMDDGFELTGRNTLSEAKRTCEERKE